MEEKKQPFIIPKDVRWIILKKYKKKIFPGENKKENRLSIRYKVKTLLN